MGLFGSFLSKFSRTKASIEDLDEFRRVLIEADLGVTVADEIIELVKREKSENLEAAVVRTLETFLSQQSRSITTSSGGLTTILIVGVNGTGKTTSAAKLAHHFTSQGKSVLLVAADTFRAAAVEQLVTWGERIGVAVVKGSENADPAAVCFDGASRAIHEGIDVLIIDTAGRLHTKSNLMDELGKVRRVVEKVTPINEVLWNNRPKRDRAGTSFLRERCPNGNDRDQTRRFDKRWGCSGNGEEPWSSTEIRGDW
jgi:fused signal recognition particle receptor